MSPYPPGTTVVVRIAAALAGATAFLLATRPAQAAVAPPDHVVLVIEENHSYSEFLGPSSPATYIKSLAASGASFTSSYAIEHPSQPNYLDLFSGSNQGTGSDTIPANTPFTTPNLGAQMIAAGYTFTGYSESLPSAGSLVTSYTTVSGQNQYVRKHNPWSDWQAPSPAPNQLPASTNQPFSAFPGNFASLPTLSVVVPNEQNDMHDGTISAGDAWLQNNIDAYRQWAATHNSLLIVTWDEDDSSASNQIATIFYGPMITTGQYSQTINHYSVLRTLEDLYGLLYAGNAATAAPLSSVVFTPEPSAGLALIALAGLALIRRRTALR